MGANPYRTPDRRMVPHYPPESCPACGRWPDAQAIELFLARWATGELHLPEELPKDFALFLKESLDELHHAISRLLVSQTPEETERSLWWVGRASRMHQHARRLFSDWMARYPWPIRVVVRDVDAEGKVAVEGLAELLGGPPFGVPGKKS